jgi:hypothetical protein
LTPISAVNVLVPYGGRVYFADYLGNQNLNYLYMARGFSGEEVLVSHSVFGCDDAFYIGNPYAFYVSISGDITIGNWRASAVEPQYGGTGINSSMAVIGEMLVCTSTGVWGLLPAGTTGQVLTGRTGNTPHWV